MNDAERISQLENLVAKLTEVVRLQGRRIDRLEAELEMRGCTVDVIVARKAADGARALALGAGELAAANLAYRTDLGPKANDERL